MSDLEKLEKKYEKGGKAKEIRDLAKRLEGPEKAAFGIYPKAGKRAKREGPDSAQKAISQAVAGFRSQVSGLDDEGKVGVGRGAPGLYYNTVAIPALAGIVDEKYAPEFAVAADKKAGAIKEAIRKDMGIESPRGPLEHFAYAGGEMLGQLPVPASLMAKIVGSARKLGTAGKVAAAPVEYLSPTVDPRAINYGIGTAFGGTLGVVGEALEEEPVKKALGGLIQKYENGGKVGKVNRFFSSVDKAIETLKQKKGTGEQIQKQIEQTPGVKQEELKFRGLTDIKDQPKITQEELRAKAAKKPAPIPKRTVLGKSVGVPEDYKPKIPEIHQRLLDEYGIEPVINPDDRTVMGFHHIDTGEIADADLIKQMPPDEMGLPVRPDGTMDPQAADDYRNLKRAVDLVERQFQVDLAKYQPKYQRYSQPGGENYREVLVSLPNERPPFKTFQSENGSWGIERSDGLRIDGWPNEQAAIESQKSFTAPGEFRSSHYDVPNILTHFRVSDRVGPNGEKVLYVDEIQSDWHQKARDVRKNYIKEQLSLAENDIHKKAVEEAAKKLGSTEITDKSLKELERIKSRMRREMKVELEKTTPKEIGYASAEDSEKIRELDAKITRLNNEGPTMEELADYFQPGKIVKGYGGTDKVLSFNPRNGDWSVTVIEVDPRTGEPAMNARPRTHSTSPGMEMRQQLLNEKRQYGDKVPDAPFKDTWHELAVKEIMDIAANEGYAKVAFSPGIEQIKRYEQSMRQAVDTIQYAPDENGEMVVKAIKQDRPVFEGKLDGDTFVSGPGAGKTLSEVFGGEIAKKMEAQPFGQIMGEDLTIGGEGMKSFYDKRLPDYVRKYGGKEFDAKSDYADIQMTKPAKAKPTEAQIKRMIEEIDDADDEELMERVMGMSYTRVNQELERRGINRNSPNYEQEFEELMYGPEDWSERFYDEALRELAIERMTGVEPGKTLRAFTIDVTPKMREKITTEGQKLFAATPAIGLGAAQTQQPAEEAPQEQAPVMQDEPQGFQEGGRVGKLRDAAEGVLRVLHGSPTRVNLEKGKNLDVTTDPGYATKRAMDKMSMFKQEGPPMLNKFDIPAKRLLRFEETYSPEDVALMRRYFNKLPADRAMTGEEIYDAAMGKDYVLEGIAKASGMAGYERPAGGSGGKGNWYRITEQDELVRKARGGLAQMRRTM